MKIKLTQTTTPKGGEPKVEVNEYWVSRSTIIGRLKQQIPMPSIFFYELNKEGEATIEDRTGSTLHMKLEEIKI